MSCKCDVCGKFRKKEDCVYNSAESNDGIWLECRYCMSGSDKERYFKDEKLSKEGGVDVAKN